jgi:hypothetical protein
VPVGGEGGFIQHDQPARFFTGNGPVADLDIPTFIPIL